MPCLYNCRLFRFKLLLFAFFTDQTTKLLVEIYHDVSPQFKGFGFSYCKSEGYLFGLFLLISYRRWLVVVLMLTGLFIIQLFFRFYWREFRRNRLTYSSFSLIVGGFLGNFLDCIVFKYVRDFIALPSFPTKVQTILGLRSNISTNLADGFILAGLILILVEFWINRDFRRILFKVRPLRSEFQLVAPLFKLPIQDIKKLFQFIQKTIS